MSVSRAYAWLVLWRDEDNRQGWSLPWGIDREGRITDTSRPVLFEYDSVETWFGPAIGQDLTDMTETLIRQAEREGYKFDGGYWTKTEDATP